MGKAALHGGRTGGPPLTYFSLPFSLERCVARYLHFGEHGETLCVLCLRFLGWPPLVRVIDAVCLADRTDFGIRGPESTCKKKQATRGNEVGRSRLSTGRLQMEGGVWMTCRSVKLRRSLKLSGIRKPCGGNAPPVFVVPSEGRDSRSQ